MEVVSPNDLACEVDENIREYLAAGFPLLWVIFQNTRTVHVYQPGQPIVVLGENYKITGEPVLPGFVCSVRESFPADATGAAAM